MTINCFQFIHRSVESDYPLMLQIPASASVQQFVHLADLVKTLTHTFSNSTDLGLQACVPWLLGHLYLSSCNISAESKTTGKPLF